MEYQLVFQFRGTTLPDFDALIALEDELHVAVSAIADVDGHDIGSGEINIFFYTAVPTECLERSKPLLSSQSLLSNFVVAYREVEAEDYVVIWPEDSTGAFDIT